MIGKMVKLRRKIQKNDGALGKLVNLT